MIRDIDALRQGPFDLLVIGGGIYGAWTALEAARLGLKTAIVDKGDWACGTSMASTKLIHGGLRYLEHLRLDLVRTSLEERRELTVIAPHLVQPLRFFIPFYQDNRVGPLKLKTGLWLYDLMAGKGQPVPPHTRLGRTEAAENYPFLNSGGLAGGFTYGDCQTDDFRMVLEIVEAGQKAGAVALNYVKAVALMSRGRTVTGAVVQDLPSGATFEVPATVVVNATGPWVPLLDDIHLLSSQVRYSKGVHLLMPPLPTQDALLLMTGTDNRIFFIVPWYGRSLLGTTDGTFEGPPDTVGIEPSDVEYLLGEANRHLHGVKWKSADVVGGFAGLRTLQNEPGKTLSQVTREWTLLEPRPHLLVSIGGKYTSARIDAAKIVSRVLRMLGRPAGVEAAVADYRLPGAPRPDFGQWRREMMPLAMAAGLDQTTAAFLLQRFGAKVPAILDLLHQEPGLARRIAAEVPFCWAEALHSLRHEMVVHLEDLLRRRLPLTILLRPDLWLVEELADLAATELKWSPADRRTEVAHLMSRWWIPPSGARKRKKQSTARPSISSVLDPM
jgi:glycerol-3-phosphate dehydrogenase